MHSLNVVATDEVHIPSAYVTAAIRVDRIGMANDRGRIEVAGLSREICRPDYF
jgi:hypothetical protein